MFWAVQIMNPDVRFPGQEIWRTREVDGTWSEPARWDVRMPGARCPVLSPNGKSLYFLSDDPDAGPNEVPPPSLVWVRRAVGDRWTEPLPVPRLLPRVKNRRTQSFSFAANGNLYFDLGGPDETGTRRSQIYCSELRAGARQEPRLLAEGINDGPVNASPWVAPDESYLIFVSNRDGGSGDDDLYISFRTRCGRWTPPLNMGPLVNTPAQEAFPSISADGRYLFFLRHSDRTLFDYYWIDGQIVKDLKLEYTLNAAARERAETRRNG